MIFRTLARWFFFAVIGFAMILGFKVQAQELPLSAALAEWNKTIQKSSNDDTVTLNLRVNDSKVLYAYTVIAKLNQQGFRPSKCWNGICTYELSRSKAMMAAAIMNEIYEAPVEFAGIGGQIVQTKYSQMSEYNDAEAETALSEAN